MDMYPIGEGFWYVPSKEKFHEAVTIEFEDGYVKNHPRSYPAIVHLYRDSNNDPCCATLDVPVEKITPILAPYFGHVAHLFREIVKSKEILDNETKKGEYWRKVIEKIAVESNTMSAKEILVLNESGLKNIFGKHGDTPILSVTYHFPLVYYPPNKKI